MTQEKVSLDNLDKFKFLNKSIVKSFIKKNISTLNNYTEGEENFLISLSTKLSLEQIVLFEKFDKKLLKKIKKFLILRLNNMPLSKIAKKINFYLDEFYINNFVLSPRKETELLVEKVLNYINSLNVKNAEKIEKIKKIEKNLNDIENLPCQEIKSLNKQEKTLNYVNNNLKPVKILDLCCGSGAIGLSIGKHSKKPCKVYLSDISVEALKVCKKNKSKLEIKNSHIIESNMFCGLKKNLKFDIIVSNPPYIKTQDLLNLDESVKNFDPTIALDGGKDGLKFYKEIAKNGKNYLLDGGVIFLEIGFDQAESVKKLFEQKGFKVSIYKDYSNCDRIIEAHLNFFNH